MAIIKHKRNINTGVVPTPANLALGEIVINTADRFVWSKDNGGALFKLLTNYNNVSDLADGGLYIKPTKLTNQDLDSITGSGFYDISGTTTNKPATQNSLMLLVMDRDGSTDIHQQATDVDGIYIRKSTDGGTTWGSWVEVGAGAGGGGGWSLFNTGSQEFTTSGTFTVPAGIEYLKVSITKATGGGGGGGGGGVYTNTDFAGGGGGGAGGLANPEVHYLAVTAGQNITVTIGAAGSGGAGGIGASTGGGSGTAGSNGTAGGTTSFGTLSLSGSAGGVGGVGGNSGYYLATGGAGGDRGGSRSAPTLFTEFYPKGGNTGVTANDGATAGGAGGAMGVGDSTVIGSAGSNGASGIDGSKGGDGGAGGAGHAGRVFVEW